MGWKNQGRGISLIASAVFTGNGCHLILNHAKSCIIIALFLFTMTAFAQSTLPAVSPNLAQKFHFDATGKFRIMQLTDPQGVYPLEEPVKELIQCGIRKYRPSLIILTGDNTKIYNKHGEFEQAVSEFMDIFVAKDPNTTPARNSMISTSNWEESTLSISTSPNSRVSVAALSQSCPPTTRRASTSS